MKIFASRADRHRALIALGFGLLAIVLALIIGQQYLAFIFDVEAFEEWLGQFGALAPVAFILAQVLQVVFAPIPGHATALVAGYFFGAVAGTVYSLIGLVIGSAIAFTIARWYGRPVVERVLSPEVIEGFDAFVEWVGVPGLLVFVLFPGTPDDAICFLAGLSTFRLRTFLIVVTIGRMPAYLITVYAGQSLAAGHWAEAVLAFVVLAIASVAGYFTSERIRRSFTENGQE